jgi:N-acetylneuraminate synthase|tara:strand:+ start:1998 stop:2846 length:849 start_codon:yes stop_codon:yes gene_type:complete
MKMELPFFIAEIGINHNGDLNIAKKLIDRALECGFNAVKFQKRDIETVYTKEDLDTSRESPWGKTTRDQKYGIEFSENDYDEIDKYCKDKKIEWFASAWDLKSLEFLKKYQLKFNKIASAMIVDLNFLEEVAKEKKYTYISTGMSTINDIEKAIEIFKRNQCKFELMYCKSTYPMKVEHANLSTIIEMKKKFGCKVGYSGHESGLAVSYAAAMLGISSLERHITLERSMYGSDQSASIEFRGMYELISVIKRMFIAYGQPKLGEILEEEKPIAKKLRKHLKI